MTHVSCRPGTSHSRRRIRVAQDAPASRGESHIKVETQENQVETVGKICETAMTRIAQHQLVRNKVVKKKKKREIWCDKDTRVVVYLRRTLEGPFLHLFFWGVLKLFCVHLFGGFLWPEIFPRNFYPQKIKKKKFDFGAPETVRAVMGSLCAQK